MFRILPLYPILIFFSVFLIYVEFLTSEKVKKSEILIKETTVIDALDYSERKNESENNLKSTDNNKLKKDKIIENEKVAIKEKINQNNDETSKEKNNQKITKFYVQYGAFSKINGTEKQIQKIESLVKKKFENFKLSLERNESNDLFKMIYNVNNKKIANEICAYSKKQKIECYVQTRKQ